MRIAIANHLPMALEALRRIILSHGKHQVAWVAADGEEAVRRCDRDRPDLILMDLGMPHLDGIEATRQIMANTPCAILIVTVGRTDYTAKVFEAMGAGALDVAHTPLVGGATNAEGRKSLLAKLEIVRRFIAPLPGQKSRVQSSESRTFGSGLSARDVGLVCIGSSAGGPAALARVLSGLPANFPAAVVIVQHVDPQFAPGLADWLASQTRLLVRLAQEGDRLQPGVVLLAGRAHHLVLANPHQLGYTRAVADCAYRPSVDIFFHSVAEHRGVRGQKAEDRGQKSDLRPPTSDLRPPTIGILLTGMGRDGAKGLLALREQGFLTLAQDQASSAVFGMPKAAADLNAAVEILALDKIAPRLVNMLMSKV